MKDNTLSTKLSSDNILLNFKNPPISKHCKVLLLTQFGKPEKKAGFVFPCWIESSPIKVELNACS